MAHSQPVSPRRRRRRRRRRRSPYPPSSGPAPQGRPLGSQLLRLLLPLLSDAVPPSPAPRPEVRGRGRGEIGRRTRRLQPERGLAPRPQRRRGGPQHAVNSAPGRSGGAGPDRRPRFGTRRPDEPVVSISPDPEPRGARRIGRRELFEGGEGAVAVRGRARHGDGDGDGDGQPAEEDG